MPNLFSQRGSIPFIALVIGVPILLIACFVIIFSTGGVNLGSGGNGSKPLQTPKPLPSKTPIPRKASDFVRVDLTVDMERVRPVYCFSEEAENIQKESYQLKTELDKSDLCIKSYDQYSNDKTQKYESCSALCDKTNKTALKKCEKDLKDETISDYDYEYCTGDAAKALGICESDCKTVHRISSVAEYNTNCQTPVVDQAFRVDDLVKKYCQEKPT